MLKGAYPIGGEDLMALPVREIGPAGGGIALAGLDTTRRLMLKESGIALLNGVVWGSVLGVVAWMLYKKWTIGLLMMAAMRGVLAQLHLYPDGSAYHLKRALASKLTVESDQLLLGNGSNEVLEMIGHAFLEPGAEVVVSQYCFAVYPIVTALFGAKLVTVPARADLGADIPAMLRAITPATRAGSRASCCAACAPAMPPCASPNCRSGCASTTRSRAPTGPARMWAARPTAPRATSTPRRATSRTTEGGTGS